MTIRRSIAFAALLQASSALMPVVLAPIIIRYLSLEDYGAWVYCMSIGLMLAALVDYGFHLSGTRAIAMRTSVEERTNTNNIILTSKLLLATLPFVGLSCFLGLTELDREYATVLVVTAGFLVVQSFLPFWFFQGLQKLGGYSVSVFLARLVGVLAVALSLFFERSLVWVPAILLLSTLVVCLYQYKRINDLGYRWSLTPIAASLDYIRSVFSLASSNLSIVFYTVLPVFTLGSVISFEAAGGYAVAERIYSATKSLYQPISTALFPAIGSHFIAGVKNGVTFACWSGVKSIVVFLVICSVTFLASKPLVGLFMGEETSSAQIASRCLEIIAFVPAISIVSNIAGIQILVNLSHDRPFMICTVIGVLFMLIGSFVVVPVFGAIGAAYLLLAVESVVAVTMCGFALHYVRRVGWV